MKNTSQLTSDLYSFIPFVQSLQDKESHFYLLPLFDNSTVIHTLASLYLQDKVYVEYYFPRIAKGVELKVRDKQEERKTIKKLITETSHRELLLNLCTTRQRLISLLQDIPQERMHAFFKIGNVSFTMYDHIEKIIWNDTLIKEHIVHLSEN